MVGEQRLRIALWQVRVMFSACMDIISKIPISLSIELFDISEYNKKHRVGVGFRLYLVRCNHFSIHRSSEITQYRTGVCLYCPICSLFDIVYRIISKQTRKTSIYSRVRIFFLWFGAGLSEKRRGQLGDFQWGSVVAA